MDEKNAMLENNFKYHPPTKEKEKLYVEYREKCKELAYFIIHNFPDIRERSLAITKLEEAMMWANAGLARN